MPHANVAAARRGLMFVLSSPSGAGKSTLSRLLLDEETGSLNMSISTTTRLPRPGEIDGEHYHFVDQATFDAKIEADGFLEYAKVFGNCYGTPAAEVEATLNTGRDVLFDIDWQGTQQLAQKMPKDLVRVFILPPSAEELARRLQGRGQDSPEVVALRMSKATDEISHWAEYDYVVINSDLTQALSQIRAILHAERLKRDRQAGLVPFVRDLMAGLG
ncbi:guanylate kinase [Govanella unica]|uniref:Guanylate kinase n=1 Tax=Govanella unica TaxID=2975056 RepID=A0A9X3TZ35_9PROT|nr:guanylate kinase [Govania unica]MDA5194352.1 guanylate kinase [Govania unica]